MLPCLGRGASLSAQLDEMQERLAQVEEAEERREAMFENELETRLASREEKMEQQFAR